MKTSSLIFSKKFLNNEKLVTFLVVTSFLSTNFLAPLVLFTPQIASAQSNPPPAFCGITQISGGAFHALMLQNNGGVLSEGYNGEGQLGNGTFTDSSSPIEVAGLSNIIQVAAGNSDSFALMNDGTVYGWGYNSEGEVGDGTTTERETPTQDTALPSGLSGNHVIAIAAGGLQALALDSAGNVWDWGRDGTGNSGPTPAVVAGLPNDLSGNHIVAIAGGEYHSMALDSSGNVWTWGDDSAGELGYSGGGFGSAPQEVPGFTGVKAIAGGRFFSLAIKTDGTVWAWGANDSGQLGNEDNTFTSSTTPVQVLNLPNTITSVSGGYNNASALDSSGNVWTWGQGNNTPSQASGLSNIQFDSTEYFSLLVEENDGTVGVYTGSLSPFASPQCITPNYGPLAGNTTVNISGANFQSTPTPTVQFNGVDATGVVVNSSTSITAVTPAQTSPGTVSVEVINGDSQNSTLQNAYDYFAAPTISSISPNEATPSGGTSVTITGTNFQTNGPTTVTIGGNAATGVSVQNSTTISATTPPGTAGPADVVVTNPDGDQATLPGGFIYGTPPDAPLLTAAHGDDSGPYSPLGGSFHLRWTPGSNDVSYKVFESYTGSGCSPTNVSICGEIDTGNTNITLTTFFWTVQGNTIFNTNVYPYIFFVEGVDSNGGVSAPSNAVTNMVFTKYVGELDNFNNGSTFGDLSGNIGFDSSGNMYVPDSAQNHGAIEIFDGSNNYLSTITGFNNCSLTPESCGTYAPNDSLTNPTAVAFDSSGNIYIADNNNGSERILKGTVDSNYHLTVSTLLTKWDNPLASLPCTGGTTNCDSFSLISGMTLENGNIYVADQGNTNGRVAEFDTNFNFIGQTGPLQSGTLGQVGGVAVDSSGDVFVSDETNNNIDAFCSSTTCNSNLGSAPYNFSYEQHFGSSGSGDSQFNGPGAMEIDSNFNLYVTDKNNNRVENWTINGNSSATYAGSAYFSGNGTSDSNYLPLTTPGMLGLNSSNNLYVGDPNGTQRLVQYQLLENTSGSGGSGGGGTNYTLTYNAGSGGTISGTSPQTVSSGGSGTQVTAVPNAGFQFVNWSDGLTTASRTDTNVTASNTYTATFTSIGPAPSVSSINPTSGPTTGGTPVTISGSNFQTGANVLFGTAADSNTEFLLHADTSSTLVDSSPNAFTITPSGHAGPSTAQALFGGSSAFFDGSNSSYLSVPASNDWNISSSDATVDYWVNLSSLNTLQYLVGTTAASNDGNWFTYVYPNGSVCIGVNGVNELCSAQGSSGSTGLAGEITTGSWHHLAFVQSGGTTTIYIDGQNVASGSTPVWSTSSNPPSLYIGGSPLSLMMGYLDEIRVSNSARWTGNFTPPTTPYESIVEAANTNVSNSSTITAITPANAVGAADVTVINPDHQSGVLTDGFTYTFSSGSVARCSVNSPDHIDGGGWTPLTSTVAQGLDGTTSKEYLYTYCDGWNQDAWYKSPSTPLAWDWTNGQQIAGLYAYSDGANISGSYQCNGNNAGELPQFGIGCSNGPYQNYKTLPYYNEYPSTGQVEICQDQPGVFTPGHCEVANVYVRNAGSGGSCGSGPNSQCLNVPINCNVGTPSTTFSVPANVTFTPATAGDSTDILDQAVTAASGASSGSVPSANLLQVSVGNSGGSASCPVTNAGFVITAASTDLTSSAGNSISAGNIRMVTTSNVTGASSLSPALTADGSVLYSDSSVAGNLHDVLAPLSISPSNDLTNASNYNLSSVTDNSFNNNQQLTVLQTCTGHGVSAPPYTTNIGLGVGLTTHVAPTVPVGNYSGTVTFTEIPVDCSPVTGVTLSNDIDNSVTSFNVSDASQLTTSEVIFVDAEKMQITGINGNQITVSRGVDGTIVSSHNSGTTIYNVN